MNRGGFASNGPTGRHFPQNRRFRSENATKGRDWTVNLLSFREDGGCKFSFWAMIIDCSGPVCAGRPAVRGPGGRPRPQAITDR